MDEYQLRLVKMEDASTLASFIVPMWKKRRSLLNMKHLMQKSSSAASEKHGNVPLSCL